MANTPASIDRQIGRSELGGTGGGRVLCPIFDPTTDSRNFGFRTDDIPPELQQKDFRDREGNRFALTDVVPPEEVSYIPDGEIAVLNLSVLYFYAIETHYLIDDTKEPREETAEQTRNRLVNFQLLNWMQLVRRAVSDPTNKSQVAAFVKTAIVLVRLQGSKPTLDPRTHLIDVQTTMSSQIIPGQSYGIPISNTGRTTEKSNVRRKVAGLRSRTRRLLNERLDRV